MNSYTIFPTNAKANSLTVIEIQPYRNSWTAKQKAATPPKRDG
jgi:hypothetical protein